LSTRAQWRSLKSNQRLPTYIVIAAVVVGVIALAVRHHVLNEQTLIFFLVFIPAVMLHEVSHGVVALWCGDDTAKRAGRLTLNPLKHIDPFGSIVLPLILALTGAPVFGWAKPVPVSINRLRHPRNDSVLVSFAGPATNVILAAIAGLALHELLHVWIPPYGAGVPQLALIEQILFYFGIVNVVLAVFNMLPIPPLDGSALVERLLPVSALPAYYRMRMGFMVVVILLVFLDQSLLSRILFDVENWYLNLVF
jgi:Zn-dependent protease